MRYVTPLGTRCPALPNSNLSSDMTLRSIWLTSDSGSLKSLEWHTAVTRLNGIKVVEERAAAHMNESFCRCPILSAMCVLWNIKCGVKRYDVSAMSGPFCPERPTRKRHDAQNHVDGNLLSSPA